IISELATKSRKREKHSRSLLRVFVFSWQPSGFLVMGDPRRYQIAALAGLLVYGFVWLRFDLRLDIVAPLMVVTLATQFACWQAVSKKPVDFKSALISALSLCLLLRTSSPLVAALAAFVTIASKFVIRVRGKHVFNPTNAGLVFALLVTPNAWVSPGQW